MPAKNTAKDVTDTIETLAADTQKAAKEQMEKVTDGLEKLAAFGQENVDALVKTQEIAVKAAENLSAEISAYSKKSFDDSVAASQDLAAAKNVTELFEKQSAFAKSYFEGFVKQTTKVNDLMAASMKDIAQPMSARVTAAAETAKSFS